ncbi:hypothetical protein Taro_036319 [Colocasia esculenta]|uniref:Amine oxidase domain-containing protein n=1 Tax=Colocasia esculenta TaxID=4460 RepID=A0A843W6F9_COLES|nr:hypothetical protein [Colocasia esculenta]
MQCFLLAASYVSHVEKRKQTLSPSAIVIGGGFAGISAARALKDASFQVVLLESRDRIGGRVYTDYSFSFPVDMGASWLHGVSEENPLGPVIARLGLPLYRTSGDNSVLFDHDLESYALFDTDGHQVPHQLVKKVGMVFETILKETEKLRQDVSEDMSMKEAISVARRTCTQSPTMVLMPDGGMEELLSGGHGLMVRGYLPVIKKLARGLDIRLGHKVTKVAWGRNGAKVSVSNGKTFIADVAVIAVPLGVLKSKAIKFEPELPEWKQAAIADLEIGIENKIALHFDKVFWPNVEFLGVVSSSTYQCSYFLNLHKATGHPVLVYMPAGKLARDIEKMTDEAAAKFTFLQLRKILPDASEPIDYLVSHWGTDENSLGSYSYDGVGKSHALYEKLRIPVDNLFFAGEATSMPYPGTVHGAFATGLMAAEECKMRVAERHDDLELYPVMAEEMASVSVPLLISRM